MGTRRGAEWGRSRHEVSAEAGDEQRQRWVNEGFIFFMSSGYSSRVPCRNRMFQLLILGLYVRALPKLSTPPKPCSTAPTPAATARTGHMYYYLPNFYPLRRH